MAKGTIKVTRDGMEAAPAALPVRDKWEYLMVASNYVSGERLNLLGQDGWELVTVAPNAWYYLKRKIL